MSLRIKAELFADLKDLQKITGLAFTSVVTMAINKGVSAIREAGLVAAPRSTVAKVLEEVDTTSDFLNEL
jgi:hypothetical protein